MSGWRRRKEYFGGRARAAATLAAVGVAVASLGTVALGSSSASAREGRSRTTVDLGEALAAGRDGKLVVAGLSSCSGRSFALARYTAAGTLDRSFGTGGKVLTGFGARTYAAATAVAIGRDGRIVAAGGEAIARYTVAGKLDRTFGRGGKVFDSAVGVYALAIQANGKVVTAGLSWRRGRNWFALARYTRRGRPDSSFGRGGKVVTDFGARSSASASAVAIQPDGKIVAAGDRAEQNFALARYNADGTLDRSFGQGGRVVTKVHGNYASALVVQPDGEIVAAGSAGRTSLALVRYSADGKLDPSFGDGGTVVTTAARGSGLAIQRDRKLVTAGTGTGRSGRGVFALARFLEDGSFDASFGRGGKLLTAFPFPLKAVANAVVVSADAKIVVAGTGGGHDFALARYSSSGRLDGSFGSGGKVLTDFGSVCPRRGR
jgi:uncharacterized delta-60 repeat protein